MLVTPVTTALGFSLRTALAAAALSVLIGVLLSVVLARRPRRRLARRAIGTLDAMVMLPLGISAVTVGFGFLIALDAPPLDLRSSPLLIPIAQAMVTIPLVVRMVLPVLRAADDRLRQAAAVLGAGPIRVWWSVDLPIMSRALAGASAFAFAVALGEFGATTFIARPENPTLPVVIGRLISRPGSTNAGHGPRCGRHPGRAVRRLGLPGRRRRSVDAAANPGSAASDARDPFGDSDLSRSGRCRAGRVARSPRACWTAACWRCSDRRAAGNPRCCGRSPGSSRSPPGRSVGTAPICARVPVHRRGFGLMFQDGVLFPHRDVAGNIAYGLRRAGPGSGADRRPSWRPARTCRPARLRRRAGWQRCPAARRNGWRWPARLAPRPRLLLLDEPLAALDRSLRERLLTDLRSVLTSTGTTAVFVTHDQAEAFAVADRMR